jgi:hypothetical protein
MPLHHGLRAAAGASPADPYFSSTSLLLLGNGTNGGQNNTFVDSSTNNFTVTRNGNTTQGSFSPFSAPDGRWSNYFDGGSDRISNASASVMDFGTNNFTVEMWVFLTSTANQMFFEGPSNSGFQFFLESGVIKSGVSGSAPVVTYTLPSGFANAWHHMCVVREGTGSNQTSLYVDGVRQSQGTLSANITTTGFQISRTSSYLVFGYISNFRVVKNSAVYTGASFTVPTAPLTAITNTSLLTCQSNRFIDNSTNAFAITPSGNAAVTSFSPFAPLAEYSAGSNGGSGYFDGSGDYLTVPDNTALDLGSSDFTIECWFYPTGGAGTYRAIAAKSDRDTAGGEGTFVIQLSNTEKVSMFFSTGGSGWDIEQIGSTSVSLNTWNHVAATRSGNTFRLFLNGNLEATATSSITLSNNSEVMTVGCLGYTSGSFVSLFYGYISSLRILKGTAQYTATFTPPTSPLTAITNTSLLLNFTNASIIDSTAKNDLETVGDAQVSTSVKKFGTGSLKFDGTGDYLKAPNNSNFQMGSGSFTIEMWLYTPSLPSAYKRVFGTTAPTISAATDEGINLEITNTNKMSGTCVVGSTYYSVTDTTDIPTSTWTHWALVRNGSTLTLYRDGTSVSTTSISGTSNWSTTFDAYVGRWVGSSARDYNGYIDDLRITKGVARYTSNFTPPSAQLPAR